MKNLLVFLVSFYFAKIKLCVTVRRVIRCHLMPWRLHDGFSGRRTTISKGLKEQIFQSVPKFNHKSMRRQQCIGDGIKNPSFPRHKNDKELDENAGFAEAKQKF
jgi:hypothetical protein